jgi:hypothetical protein
VWSVWSLDCVARLITRLRAEKFEDRIPAGTREFFFFKKMPGLAVGPIQAPIRQTPGRKVYLSPPSNTETTKECSSKFPPPTCPHGADRDNFIYLFIYLMFKVSGRLSLRCVPHITSELCVPLTITQYIIWIFSQAIAIYLFSPPVFHSIIIFTLLQFSQYYNFHSIIIFTVLQFSQYYNFHSTIIFTVLQFSQYYNFHSITIFTVLQFSQYYNFHSHLTLKNHVIPLNNFSFICLFLYGLFNDTVSSS